MSWGDNVGEESRKTWHKKGYEYYRAGGSFFGTYMNGHGLDVGYRGYLKEVHPILPVATGVDLETPGYDGKILPFPDASQDYHYSSHVLEHVDDYVTFIREAHRVVRPGGHVIIVVPHQYLYEKKKEKPSRYNEDHKRFYTPSRLLQELEESLPPNSYRVRHLQDNDSGFDYSIPPEKHSSGCYEIEVVIQKMVAPDWEIK